MLLGLGSRLYYVFSTNPKIPNTKNKYSYSFIYIYSYYICSYIRRRQHELHHIILHAIKLTGTANNANVEVWLTITCSC